MVKRLLALLLVLAVLTVVNQLAHNLSPEAPQAPAGSTIELLSVPAAQSGASAASLPSPASAPESGEPPSTAPESPISVPPSADPAAAPRLAEDGVYTSRDDVALYLVTYGRLPDNFITKAEARRLGWLDGPLEKYAPGCSIGGDLFGNREGRLPTAPGRVYMECDIGTMGKKSRGAKRIVFSNDGLIYYTDDHYESFTLLYGEE